MAEKASGGVANRACSLGALAAQSGSAGGERQRRRRGPYAAYSPAPRKCSDTYGSSPTTHESCPGAT
jgi:hypothetical protein